MRGESPSAVTHRRAQIALIGDGDASGAILQVAEEVGGRIAAAGAVLVTGGHGGVMEAACRGASAKGGTSVGILRSGDLSRANPFCDVIIGTEIEHARNVLTVLSSDAVIAIGGGAGTLSEIRFSWIHARPLFILRGYGGWSDRLSDLPLDQRRSSNMQFCSSVDELFGSLSLFSRLSGDSALSSCNFGSH
jgi:uncharacterized protein (TIGR00725 family)